MAVLELEDGVGERTLSLAGITLDGTPLDLAKVLADVTIRHGRAGYFESASPSTCQITLTGVTRALSSAVTLQRPLVVTVTDGTTTFPRFTGKTTDATLDDDELTLIAVGYLGTLQARQWEASMTFGAASWTARVDGILANLFVPRDVRVPTTPLGNPPLAAEPVAYHESPTPWDLLSRYVDYLGAAVADTPDGKILVQPAESRTTAGAVNIPASDVLYSPQWVIVLPGANSVWFDRDTPGSAHGLDTTGAIDAYGLREVEFQTTITDSSYSFYLAGAMVKRQAHPRWAIPAATLLSGRQLAIGQPLRLSGFQASAPHSSWLAIVEGWTDRIVSDGDATLSWTIELALSDPLLSGITGAAPTWDTAPTELTWDTMNQTTAWNDATTIDSLYP